jgi:hypothetical protein
LAKRSIASTAGSEQGFAHAALFEAPTPDELLAVVTGEITQARAKTRE